MTIHILPLAIVAASLTLMLGCSGAREPAPVGQPSAAPAAQSDDKATVLLEEQFDNLDRWRLEGLGNAVTIPAPGEMRLSCEGSQQGGVGAMAFCKVDFPDRIAIEYDLIVESHNGLLITFVAMQGIQGEDALTGVPAREGKFNDYVGDNASTRSYHISVCRYNDKGEHTGLSNWRRNPGLHLMTSGKDLCTQTQQTYHVRIVKEGPHCRIEVDGQIGAQFTDPGELPGPIPAAGKIGFRAIGARASFRISNFKVSNLNAGQ
ncbi:MAG: DUF1961 family protein [Phycisphaeraceae bacterium]